MTGQYRKCTWSPRTYGDAVGYYKSTSLNLANPVRVMLDDEPAIDTGGVRRQLYTDVFKEFASTTHACLWDGQPGNLRPIYSAEAQSSGLFKVLGRMVLRRKALAFLTYLHCATTT